MDISQLLIVLFCASQVVAFRRDFDPTRFKHFFPEYRDAFTSIRDGPCGQLYARKLSGEPVCLDLLDCMLEHTRESIKGDLASGVIALGVMPTLLTFLGSSTIETGLLSRRRPVLALLIALGAPSVSPIPTFVYPDPITNLEEHKGRLLPKLPVSKRAANVYTVCFYTGSWTINTLSCDSIFYPLIWAGISLPIHLLAMWSLSLSVITPRDGRSYLTLFSEWTTHELTPCITHKKLVLTRKPESHNFIMVTWFLSICTVTHTLYGVVAFSSVQFLGYNYSIQLIARLMASAIVCRAVLMFELAGMRNAVDEPAFSTQQSLRAIPLHDVIGNSE